MSIVLHIGNTIVFNQLFLLGSLVHFIQDAYL